MAQSAAQTVVVIEGADDVEVEESRVLVDVAVVVVSKEEVESFGKAEVLTTASERAANNTDLTKNIGVWR